MPPANTPYRPPETTLTELAKPRERTVLRSVASGLALSIVLRMVFNIRPWRVKIGTLLTGIISPSSWAAIERALGLEILSAVPLAHAIIFDTVVYSAGAFLCVRLARRKEFQLALVFATVLISLSWGEVILWRALFGWNSSMLSGYTRPTIGILVLILSAIGAASFARWLRSRARKPDNPSLS